MGTVGDRMFSGHTGKPGRGRVKFGGGRANFDGFGRGTYLQLAIELVRAGSDVQIANHALAETVLLHFNAVVARRLGGKGVLSAAVGGGLRYHGSLGPDKPDGCSGDRGAHLIRHRAAEVPVSTEERGGMGLRRKLHAFRQGDDWTAPIEWLGELLDEGMRSAGDKR